MRAQAPKIDSRGQEDVVRQTEQLVEGAGLGWTAGTPDAAAALIRVFGRMVAHAIERLNHAPEKHFAAFLNLIGAEPRPPQPAQVPLTFALAEGASVDALVPAGTQVAAKPLEGEDDEVLFETVLDLVVTRARIVSFLLHHPTRDFYADRGPPAPDAPPVRELDRPIEHSLYVAGGDLLTLPPGTRMTVRLTPSDAARWQALPVEWTFWDGEDWKLPPAAALSQDKQTLQFNAPASFAPRAVNGVQGHWLRASLKSTLEADGLVPSVRNVVLSAQATRSGLEAEAAFAGSFPIDQGLDFLPFGPQPKTNDTFYLASAEVFSKAGARISLAVTRSEQAAALSASDNPVLAWEVWNGAAWVEVGRSDKTREALGTASQFGFNDGTRALSRSGTVAFTLPAAMGPLSLRGTTNHWVRVRIATGNYGNGITLQKDSQNKVTGLLDDGYRPPVLQSLKLGYTYEPTRAPTALLAFNDFDYADTAGQNTSGFIPFQRSGKQGPALYVGFDRPFDNVSTTLFVDVAPPLPGELQLGGTAPEEQPVVVWEYTGPADAGWLPLGAEDPTRAFNQSGLLRFIGPADFAPRRELGLERYWLRARLARGAFAVLSRVRSVQTNTMWALHATSVHDEILGSSNGEKEQGFMLSQTPVLEAQRLEVLEPEPPSEPEQAALAAQEGEDTVMPVLNEDGHPVGAWVRWHAVTDFYGSGPRDRHYTLDSATGQVRFGDGQHGMPPPKGTRSVRASYRTGGGARGNRPAQSITQLKTAVPYVDSVINLQGASGGADREALEQIKERGPKILRHGYLAVTVDDFEDLAREASTAVARVKALTPRFDPLEQADPDNTKGVPGAGEVFLLLVPQGSDRRPTAGLGLLQDVEGYLAVRRAPAVKLKLGAPDWVEAAADVVVAPTSPEGADELRAAVSAAIERYLHPLTGGADGRGWDFGRLPHASDLYPVVGALAGVNHIRKLSLVYRKAPPQAPFDAVSDSTWPLFDEDEAGDALERVLVFSGVHTVRIASPEEE
jgi:hypothetical protein